MDWREKIIRHGMNNARLKKTPLGCAAPGEKSAYTILTQRELDEGRLILDGVRGEFGTILQDIPLKA